MNLKTLSAALAMCAAAGSVFAQGAEFVAADAGFRSQKTRAEVMAELAARPRDAQAAAMQEFTYPVITSGQGMVAGAPRGKPAAARAATAPLMPTDLYYGA